MEERVTHLEQDGGSIWTVNNFIPDDRADNYYSVFSNESFPLVNNPVIKLYGKECISHRRVGFFSDHATGYKFAGQEAVAMPTTAHIRNLLKKVNRFCDTNFNGALINDYRSGLDYIGAHSDKLNTLDSGVVAAISFGTQRIFRIRDKDTKKILIDIPTANGQLLVMDGKFQELFTHEIPPSKRINDGRVSFTCRVHNLS